MMRSVTRPLPAIRNSPWRSRPRLRISVVMARTIAGMRPFFLSFARISSSVLPKTCPSLRAGSSSSSSATARAGSAHFSAATRSTSETSSSLTAFFELAGDSFSVSRRGEDLPTMFSATGSQLVRFTVVTPKDLAPAPLLGVPLACFFFFWRSWMTRFLSSYFCVLASRSNCALTVKVAPSSRGHFAAPPSPASLQAAVDDCPELSLFAPRFHDTYTSEPIALLGRSLASTTSTEKEYTAAEGFDIFLERRAPMLLSRSFTDNRRSFLLADWLRLRVRTLGSSATVSGSGSSGGTGGSASSSASAGSGGRGSSSSSPSSSKFAGLMPDSFSSSDKLSAVKSISLALDVRSMKVVSSMDTSVAVSARS
mmetsp:Transcript_9485/g.38760  ORF Transcript_9485/g.38760 Transcript_9485/m.38760 type:complete len:367 (-) Transcript_9485:186-1286(-)